MNTVLPDHVLQLIFSYVMHDIDADTSTQEFNNEIFYKEMKNVKENLVNLLSLWKVSERFAALTEYLWSKSTLRIDFEAIRNWETSLERECLALAPVLGTLIFFDFDGSDSIAKVAAELSKHHPRRIRRLFIGHKKISQSDFSTVLNVFADHLEELSVWSPCSESLLRVGPLPKLKKLVVKDNMRFSNEVDAFPELEDIRFDHISSYCACGLKILHYASAHLKRIEFIVCHRGELPTSIAKLRSLDFPRLESLTLDYYSFRCDRSCSTCEMYGLAGLRWNSGADQVMLCHCIETFKTVSELTLIFSDQRSFMEPVYQFLKQAPLNLKKLTLSAKCNGRNSWRDQACHSSGEEMISKALQRYPNLKFFTIQSCTRFVGNVDWANDIRGQHVIWDISTHITQDSLWLYKG